jgi:hypothetical protein
MPIEILGKSNIFYPPAQSGRGSDGLKNIPYSLLTVQFSGKYLIPSSSSSLFFASKYVN